MMGTRTGSFDPAVLLYLEAKGVSADTLDSMVNKESGLLGISGVSNDVRDLEDAAADGNERAKLALEMFAYQVRKMIGAYLAVLGGCRAIVLTGGIGENAATMRARILGGLDGLGIALDTGRNTSAAAGERDIATDDSPVRILVIPTDEERAIAEETVGVIGR
jgi:acetate kinase